MKRPVGTARASALLVAVLLAAGCGVRPQEEAETVTTAAAPSSGADGDSSAAGPRLTVYFVRGAELAAVQRRTDAATIQAALDQLVEGPSRREAATGIRTALPPEVAGVEDVGIDGLATVEVTRGFTGITGGNQLLAVAQIVWTLTDMPPVTGARFVVDGVPVEVPTDAGLTDQPVDRDDYRSVAPTEPTAPSADETPSATPTPR